MAEADLAWRAAERAAGRRFFLASALLAYARSEGLDQAGLARQLGCEPAALPRLLLCRRPTGPPAAFRADVQRIAQGFNLDPARLAEAVRVAYALERLAEAGQRTDAGLLAAARDRDDEEPEA